MKSTEEIAARALKARAAAEKHKIRLLKGVSVTLALCLLLLGGWSLSRQGAAADGGKSGGRTGDNDGSIPAIRQILEAGGISFSGSRITEEEAAAYFEAYGEAILQELAAGGVKVKEPHFSETGVSHVRIAEGKAVCKTDWRDYLLFDGEALAAIVTLSREDGPLRHFTMWGGSWQKSYASFLAAHKGEELVYVYVENGGAEDVILTASGEAVSPLGTSMKQFFPGDFDYYSALKTTYNVLVP